MDKKKLDESETVVNKKKDDSAKSRDLETRLSKNILPILGSILIFVGLGSFARLILREITEPVKCLVMFLFSFVLFGFGVFRLNREKSNLNLAISACGVGTVYISLLVSCFYFNYLSEFWLFNLMVLWSGLVYYLACLYKDNIFAFISYIGFSYAVYLALVSNFIKPVLFLVLAFFVAAINYFYGTEKVDLFYFKCKKDKINTRYFYFGSSLLMFIRFSYICKDFYRPTDFFDGTFIFLGFIILFASNLFNLRESSKILMPDSDNYDSGKTKIDDSNNKFIYVLLGIVNLLASYFCAGRFDQYISGGQNHFLSFIMSIIFICFYAFFIENKSILNIILLYYPCERFFNSGIGLFSFNQTTLTLFLILALVLLFVASWFSGVYFNKSYFKYMACLPIFSCSTILMIKRYLVTLTDNLELTLDSQYCLSIAICILFILGVNIFLAIRYGLNDIYILISNCFLFGLAAGNISFGLFGDMDYLGVIISLFVTAFLLVFQWFYYDLFSQKKDLFSTFNVINNLTLFFNILMLFVYKDESLSYFIIFVLSLAQYVFMFKLIDLVDYQKDKKDESIGYWIGLKSTIYLCGVLHSLLKLENMTYIYSIVFIWAAILFIILGKKMRLKSLRLYGLWMSIIFALKLSLLDISHDNSIGFVFSLIISGLLCFAIAFVYNKIDNQDDDN